MNSKNKYFKYNGNYYNSKEYIALKNKEIITQSGGDGYITSAYNKFKTYSNENCKNSEKTCLKNPAQQVLDEISNGLSELGDIMNYIKDYFTFLQAFVSNKYRVYYIPLTYRYNLTFKNIPWLFTLRSPLFYRSMFSDMQTLNLINKFVYDKKMIRNAYLKSSINLYHTIFKNFQEGTDKYVWNEVFEKLFIPLASDAPVSQVPPPPLPTNVVGGGGFLSSLTQSVSGSSATDINVPAIPTSVGSGSVDTNDYLKIEINDVKNKDAEQYKRLTRESFNFLLLILQNIALINENRDNAIDKIKQNYYKESNEANENKYRRIITIGNFLKTGVLNLKDKDPEEIFKIWNSVRKALKKLIKNQANAYESIQLYKESQDENGNEANGNEDETFCPKLQEIIKEWNKDSYIKSIFKTIYDVEDAETFNFKDIKLDLANEMDCSNHDDNNPTLVYHFIRLNIISLNILSLKLSDFDEKYEQNIKKKLKMIDKIFVTCYLINIRNIPKNDKDEDGKPDEYKLHKVHFKEFQEKFKEEYKRENEIAINKLEELEDKNHLDLKITINIPQRL